MKKVLLWCLGPGVVLALFALIVGGISCHNHVVERDRREQGAKEMKWNQAGWEAGMEGAPPEVCPHGYDTPGREAWMKGWRKGRLERSQLPEKLP